MGILLALPLSAQSGGERIWLHTDAPAYKAGDRIHFKAYVLDMDGRTSSAESRYLYVEMGQDDRMLGKRVKVMEKDGLYEGTMDIPEETPAGVYSLRAYTLRMGQAGVFSYQDIQVGRPHYLQAETMDTTLSDSFESLSVPVRVRLTSRPDSALLLLDMSGLREGEWADLSLSVFIGNYKPLSPVWRGAPREILPKHEDTQSLSGTVTTAFRRRPVKDADVGLISPQAGIMATTRTDENGVFCFDGLDFPEGTQYLVRTDEKYELRILETDYPKFSSSGCRYRDKGWAAPLSEWAEDAIELDAAAVSATAVVDPPKGFSALADFTFGPHQIEEISATCMHEILRRVPGVFIREEAVDGHWEERVTSVPTCLSLPMCPQPLPSTVSSWKMSLTWTASSCRMWNAWTCSGQANPSSGVRREAVVSSASRPRAGTISRRKPPRIRTRRRSFCWDTSIRYPINRPGSRSIGTRLSGPVSCPSRFLRRGPSAPGFPESLPTEGS